MKLLSNFEMASRFPDDLEICFYPLDAMGQKQMAALIHWFRQARASDAVVITNTTGLLTLITIAARLLPGRHPKIFLWDTNLRRPDSLRSWLGCLVMRWIFRFVDLFLVMHRDLTGYERYYRIPRRKFRFVSWKANNIHRADSMNKTDEGYVLACGASYRDYDTFNRAMEIAGPPAKIVLPLERVARRHNSRLNDASCPDNVRVIRHDRSKGSWDAYLAHARIIVVPVMKGALQPAGIATCYQAMALGKPVVISRGVSTEGVLPDGVALIYEPGDAHVLAAHVQSLWGNPELRRELGERGRTFVQTLGDDNRIGREIQEAIVGAIKK